ncbi:MAG TPA: DUF4238 domain-containing protein [Opitutales bacterium]|nr:DUF4238 domain-containing protein [Opitutales bacterium]
MHGAKKQHYLPCVYLKQFSSAGANATRTSKVWRLDSKRCIEVTVKSEGHEKYFYSKSDPEKPESHFGNIEMQYGLIAQKIWRSQVPTRNDYFGLIVVMIDIHLRSPIYQNQTGAENFKAYETRVSSLGNILGVPKSDAAMHEIKESFRKFWRVRLLKSAPNYEFITSDCPSLWFTTDEHQGPQFFIMPITPFHLAVAFDLRHVRMQRSNQITNHDQLTVTRDLIGHSQNAIYCREKPSLEMIEKIRTCLSRRRTPTGVTNNYESYGPLLVWSEEDRLDFVNPVRPPAKVL